MNVASAVSFVWDTKPDCPSNSNMPNPHQCRRNNDDDKGYTPQPIIEKKVPDNRSGPIQGKQSGPIVIMPVTK